MPCTKCADGKWKWGHRGSCRYSSYAECEAANKGKAQEGNVKQWFKMLATEDPAVHEVLIYDFIGDWIDGAFDMGVSAQAFMTELSGLPDSVKTIRVHVNSPGGDVFGAITIANALRDQRVSKGRKVEMIVDGLAASAASLVIMAGDVIRVADNGIIMIHNAWTMTRGNAADLRAEADRLEKLRDATIVPTYQWHSALSADEIVRLMDAETWMDADEAIGYGFATEKASGLRAVAALTPCALAKLNVPERFQARIEAMVAAAVPPKKEEEPSEIAPEVEPAAEEPAAEEPASADPTTEEAPTEETAAPPAAPEKKETPDLLESMKEHLEAATKIHEGHMDGSIAMDEASMTELQEHLTLLQEALDQMPPMPKPIEKEAPKPEAPAADPAPKTDDDAAAARATLDGFTAGAQAAIEIIDAQLVPSVPAAEVIRACADNKLSVDFAAALAAAEPTREELSAHIALEKSRIEADSSRKAAVRAMFKKHNMAEVGDDLADAGVGVAAAGRLVTKLKAMKDSVEIDGGLAPSGPGPKAKVLSYREKIARANNPNAFQKE